MPDNLVQPDADSDIRDEHPAADIREKADVIEFAPVLRSATRLYGGRLASWAMAHTGDPLAELTQPRGRRDPWSVFRRAQSRGPLFRSKLGPWVTGSHAVVKEIVRDRRYRVRNAADRANGLGPLDPGLGDSLVDIEPPEHTRLRRMVMPAFTRIRALEAQSHVEHLVGELLDEAERKHHFDLVSDLAAPLPLMLMAELLGVPDIDADRFAYYGRASSVLLDGVRSVREAHAVRQVVAELTDLFVGVARARATDPREDLISSLVAPEDRLSDKEIATLSIELLIAGTETTTCLLANMVSALLAHRDQWDDVCADPHLAAAAVEETLRYDPPVRLNQRTTVTAVELAGRQLPAGATVVLGISGANRDPDVFASPDRFDIHRGNAGDHLTFSAGHHFCMGAPLARLEGEVVLRSLVQRFPALRLAGSPVRRGSTVIGGVQHLPVTA